MSKELNIIEAINMGKQSKFKMIRKNGFEFEVIPAKEIVFTNSRYEIIFLDVLRFP